MTLFEAMEIKRPCIVEGKKALFHTWIERSRIFEPSPLRGGHNGGVAKWTAAIIEFEDGQVAEVMPSDIRFLDHPHSAYDFTEREDEKK